MHLFHFLEGVVSQFHIKRYHSNHKQTGNPAHFQSSGWSGSGCMDPEIFVVVRFRLSGSGDIRPGWVQAVWIRRSPSWSGSGCLDPEIQLAQIGKSSLTVNTFKVLICPRLLKLYLSENGFAQPLEYQFLKTRTPLSFRGFDCFKNCEMSRPK